MNGTILTVYYTLNQILLSRYKELCFILSQNISHLFNDHHKYTLSLKIFWLKIKIFVKFQSSTTMNHQLPDKKLIID